MVIGVTMINVVPGQDKAAYSELCSLEGIKEVYHVFGEYDFVAVIEVKGLSALNALVAQIRENKSVTVTKTVVGAEL
ncbi:MAG: Lrp/AsnC family transcriptional regulator [Methanosarcinales archaeon]|nr:MAG: Lrp/AsnC family transcriptional regulator [Methanosarcinales archaeon]